MLVAGEAVQGSLCATDAVAELLEDLQFTLGEGPCIDAHNLGRAVLEPNLSMPDVPRWPAFAPRAVEAGAQAVFGFPVRVGAARLGSLNLYRDRPGALSDDEHAYALVMANVAARAILAMQAGALPGELATELEAEANFRFVVHQAAGMVSVQLGVTIAQALVRLRALAFRTDRLIVDVAQDVVSRRLRFNDSTDEVTAAWGPLP
jgi:GAF domain-containing protein